MLLSARSLRGALGVDWEKGYSTREKVVCSEKVATSIEDTIAWCGAETKDVTFSGPRAETGNRGHSTGTSMLIEKRK